MKGLIVAYGERDSLGHDRLKEPRGLLRFGGKEVVKHILDRLYEVGVGKDILLVVHPANKKQYESSLGSYGKRVNIFEYHGLSDPIRVYINALTILGKDDPVLTIADDNLFDFSLEKMVERHRELRSSLVAVRDVKYIGDPNLEQDNFGKCLINKEKRIIKASYSFWPRVSINSEYITLDIYLADKSLIHSLLSKVDDKTVTSYGIVERFSKNSYAWVANDGFWADVGKPSLRQKAEEYFSDRENKI